MIIFWTITAAFANYRISVALATEEGPFELFQTFRNLFVGSDWLARGMRCFKCISFWMAIPFSFLVGIDSWQHFFILWLGIASLPLVLDRYWSR